MAIYKRDNPTALASATSANGTDRNGTALTLETVHPGMIAVECVGSITTSSVIATYKAQGSTDNTTWTDLKLPNNAANVATAAGTGSAVAHRLALMVPVGVQVYPYLRVVATLSGAATAAADVTAASYRIIRAGGIEF